MYKPVVGLGPILWITVERLFFGIAALKTDLISFKKAQAGDFRR